MLTIEPPFYQLRNSLVFRDHLDPDQLYLLPVVPKISSFQMRKYRPDPTNEPARQGGSAEALVEVTIPPGDVAQLRSEVAAESGRASVRLSPVVFGDGKAHVSFATMPDRAAETAVVSPLSPHAVVFLLRLGAEGAALLERAAAGEQVPAGVAYELRFSALTPPLHARVTMDYERIYDHLAASAAHPHYVQTDIDTALTGLMERAAFTIEMTGDPDPADPRREPTLLMDLVKARIQRDFFRAGIPSQPEAGMAGALPGLLKNLLGSEVASASAVFVLKPREDVVREQKTFELTYDGPEAVELTHLCTVGLSLPADGSIAPIVREFDGDPFFETLVVQVEAAMAFETLPDLRTVIVNFVYGEKRGSLLFERDSSARQSFRASLTNGQHEYRYDVEYRFDPASSDGPEEIKAGPYRSTDRVLMIAPAAHMRLRRLEVFLASVDLATIPRQEVTLRVQGEPGQPEFAPRMALLDRERQSVVYRWRVPMASPAPRIFARVRWFDTSGISREQDEFEVIGDAVIASGPPLVLNLRVHSLAKWTAVDRVIVHIRYQDGDYVNTREVALTQGTTGPAVVKIPILDRQRRAYQWRQTILRKDGTIEESELASSDAANLVVGLMKASTHD